VASNAYVDLGAAMPLENYLTNCLANLIKTNPVLLTSILGNFFHNLPHDRISSVKTQDPIESGIADVRICFEGKTQKELVIENKFGSHTDPDQLRRYLNGNPTRYVVLIALDPFNEIKHRRFQALTWTKLAEMLSNQKRQGKQAQIRDFIEFLATKGIELISGFDRHEVGKAWDRYLRFSKTAKTFLAEGIKEMNSYRPRRFGQDAADSNELGYYWHDTKKRQPWRYFVSFLLDARHAKMVVGVFFGTAFKAKLQSRLDSGQIRSTRVQRKLMRAGFEFRLEIDDRWKWIGKTKSITGRTLAQCRNFRRETLHEMRDDGLIWLLRSVSRG
jgi:hypothetical protein